MGRRRPRDEVLRTVSARHRRSGDGAVMPAGARACEVPDLDWLLRTALSSAKDSRAIGSMFSNRAAMREKD